MKAYLSNNSFSINIMNNMVVCTDDPVPTIQLTRANGCSIDNASLRQEAHTD